MPTLRALMIEDSDTDVVLLLRELKRSGFEIEHARVETEAELVEALKQAWDVALCDFNLPKFDAFAALAIVQQRRPELPFILVSGTIGEERAVEVMRAGAQDFVLKDRLTRLGAAVARELRAAVERRTRRDAERALQTQLMMMDRMASIGLLAAGVAHEINNPLTVLTSTLELVAGEIEAEKALAARFEEPFRDAREAAEQARQIILDLKVFSRADEERVGPTDVKRTIESSVRMAWNEVRHRAKLVCEIAPSLPPVVANEGRLVQAFLNLLVNAAQSIPEGAASANTIEITARQGPRSRVTIEVRDSGVGISASDLAHVFDGFFATKSGDPAPRRAGLGLLIVKRIVEDFAGTIEVESAGDRGNVFRVVLPTAAATAPPPRIVRSAAGPSRRARVLVIDDELPMCKSIARLLGGEHDVTITTSAAEALAKIGGGEDVDLVLCDVMMPEVSGVDVHERLSLVAPKLAEEMVFITGGAFTERARQFLDRVSNERLEKPFNADELRDLVRRRAARLPSG